MTREQRSARRVSPPRNGGDAEVLSASETSGGETECRLEGSTSAAAHARCGAGAQDLISGGAETDEVLQCSQEQGGGVWSRSSLGTSAFGQQDRAPVSHPFSAWQEGAAASGAAARQTHRPPAATESATATRARMRWRAKVI